MNLSDHSQSIIWKVIQRNGYFAHLENIIIALINDASSDLRKLGWRQIMKARMNNKKKSAIKFNIPQIQFEFYSYYHLINWNTEITESPLTSDYTDEEIASYIETGDLPRLTYIL